MQESVNHILVLWLCAAISKKTLALKTSLMHNSQAVQAQWIHFLSVQRKWCHLEKRAFSVPSSHEGHKRHLVFQSSSSTDDSLTKMRRKMVPVVQYSVFIAQQNRDSPTQKVFSSSYFNLKLRTRLNLEKYTRIIINSETVDLMEDIAWVVVVSGFNEKWFRYARNVTLRGFGLRCKSRLFG